MRSVSSAVPFRCGLAGKRNFALGLFLLITGSLAAEDLESWSEARLKVLDTGRVELTVGGVARVRDSLGSLYDRRATAEAGVALTDRFRARLGYVLRHHDPRRFGFGSDHRFVAGLTYPILQQSVSVEGTTLYERHVGQPDVPDFNRYRQQVDVEQVSARVSPWLHQSLAFEREGFFRSRSRAGFRWRIASGHSLRCAYQFESIDSGTSRRPRHAIISEWRYDLVPIERGLR